MVKRFLLNGVRGKPGGMAVSNRIEFSVFVFPYIAKAAGMIGNVTVPGTQGTDNTFVGPGFPPGCRNVR